MEDQVGPYLSYKSDKEWDIDQKIQTKEKYKKQSKAKLNKWKHNK